MSELVSDWKATMKTSPNRCNICGAMSKMTDDHVPPQCWNNSKRKYYSQGFGLCDPPKKKEHCFPHITGNGIKFRTICEKCNTTVLGPKDKALSEFIKQIETYIKRQGNISSIFNCTIYANSVAKAIVGHMLAAKEYYDESTNIDNVLRSYVLDEAALPPSEMQLLYFYYPYKSIVIERDVVLPQVHYKDERYKKPVGIISCLFSYPLAVILSNKHENLQLHDLFAYGRSHPSTKTDVVFNLNTRFYPGTKQPRDPLWPINISDEKDGSSFMLSGKAAQRLIIGIDGQE